MRRSARSRGGLAVAVWLASASGAAAHAPLPRNAALTPDGSQVAVALPGFGLLLRGSASAPFVYACDTLLSNQPRDVVAQLSYLRDGSLLMGSLDGVRIIAPDGCPRAGAAGELSYALVTALAAHQGSTEVVYAAVAGDKAGLWRSEDGGQSWLSRGPLAGAELVSALLIDEQDPRQLYLSKNTPQGRSLLLFSSDGGESFRSVEQARALTLLHLKSATSKQLWAVAPSLDNDSNRGFDLLHADSLDGPWLLAKTVNYFGGFAIDARGSVWLGDEGGGVYRSDDGGASFQNVDPAAATACLVSAGEALYGCTQGTPVEPALASFGDATRKVVAFTDVRALVDCGPDVDVPKRCAAAWIEWRRDVLMEDVAVDAGARDAGTPTASADAAATETRDAGAETLDASVSAPKQDSGCALTSRTQTGGAAPLLGVLALALCRRRRR